RRSLSRHRPAAPGVARVAGLIGHGCLSDFLGYFPFLRKKRSMPSVVFMWSRSRSDFRPGIRPPFEEIVMPVVTLCPSAAAWQHLLGGQIAPENLEPALRHLEQCPRCTGVVQAL